MGGDTVEAGNKSAFPPNKAKEEGTLQKCDISMSFIKGYVPPAAALASSLTACPLTTLLVPS